MTGGELQKKIMTFLEKTYKERCYIINVVKAGKSGNPDLVVCIDGQFYGFEVKAGRDTDKPLQSAQLARIGDAGGCGGFVRSVADVEQIIALRTKPKWDSSEIIHKL